MNGWKRDWRGSLSGRTLIAENRCAALFVSTVSPDSETRIGAAVWAPGVTIRHFWNHARRGPCPCRGAVDAQRLRAGDTVETKRSAHRFSAIRVRPLNVTPRTHAAAVTSAVSGIRRQHCWQTVTSVPIRPWHDRHRAPTLQRRSYFQSPVTRLKQKEQRTGFTAIRMRPLNDARRGSLPTVQPLNP